MVISVDAEVTTDKDASGAVRRGTRQAMEDAMAVGFALSQELVPEDRGTLRMSGYEPTWDGDTIHWGYRAAHAEPIEDGTKPFLAPFDPLLEWAERQGADSPWGLASYVWRKIAKEGVDAQPYAEPGREKTKQYLQSRGIDSYIEVEL